MTGSTRNCPSGRDTRRGPGRAAATLSPATQAGAPPHTPDTPADPSRRLNILRFSEGGCRYVFAATSLFLFEVDDLTDAVLQRWGRQSAAEMRQDLREHAGGGAVDAVIAEVERLIAAGILAGGEVPAFCRRPDPQLPDAGGTPAFTDLWLILTHGCNLACRYCFSDAEYMRADGRMTEEVAFRGVDFLLAHAYRDAPLNIVFFGGEPLIAFALLESTVDYARRRAAQAGKQIGFAITTNGMLLTPEVRRFLLDNSISTMISMDGPKAQHDAARRLRNGAGSFDRVAPLARAFAAEAKRAGQDIRGRATLHRGHLGAVDALYAFLDEDMGFGSVSTPLIHRPAPDDLAITPDDLPRLEADLQRLGDRVLAKAEQTGELPGYGMFAFLRVLRERRRPQRGCAAGRLAVTVDTDGQLYPCERFIGATDYRLGSVLGGAYAADRVRQLSEQDRVCAFGKCRDCSAMLYCKSTCVAERLRYLPDTGPPDLDCETYRLMLRQILRVFVRLRRNRRTRHLVAGATERADKARRRAAGGRRQAPAG